MVLGIFTLILISTLSLIAAMVYGYFAAANPGLTAQHITVGLPAVLFLLFTHSLTMFYFIGSGKTLKEAVKEHGLSESYNEKARKFKMITSPLQTYTMLLAVLMACLGGAAQVGKISRYWHEGTAWLTLVLHLWTCVQEVRCIIQNQLLGDAAVKEITRRA